MSRKWMIILPLALVLNAYAAEDTLVLHDEAQVPGPNLLLGQLADLNGEHIKGMASLDLGPAALPGQSRHLQASLIRSMLERAGFPVDTLAIEGAPIVRVTTLHTEISSDTVRESLLQFIMAHMPWEQNNVTVDVVVPAFDVVIPEGLITIDWRPDPRYAYIGSGSFRGDIKVDGLSKKTLSCRAMIEAYGDVVVAVKDIQRGAIISPGDFTLETRALSTVPRDSITDPSTLTGLVARRTIFTGQTIMRRYVEERKVIQRNQLVIVEARTAGLTVRSRAKALADAQEGQVVACVNIDSKQEFVGVARKDGIVVIE